MMMRNRMMLLVGLLVCGQWAQALPSRPLDSDFDWKTRRLTLRNVADLPDGLKFDWTYRIDERVFAQGSQQRLPAPATNGVMTSVLGLPKILATAPMGYGVKHLDVRYFDGTNEVARDTFTPAERPARMPASAARRFEHPVLLTRPYLLQGGATGVTVACEVARPDPNLRLTWKGGSLPLTFEQSPCSPTYLATARLDGLTPGTTVDFELAGVKGSFTTWKDDGTGFKCAIFGDYQSGLAHGYRGWWDWEADPFLCGARMFEDMAASDCSFAVCTGDVADTGDYEKEIRPLVLDRMCNLLGARLPFFVAFGNHDTKYRQNHFFLPMPQSRPGLSSFAFWRDNCLFVCIDDAEVGDDVRPPSPVLRTWLEELLTSDAARKAKFRFVFQHVPIYEEDFGNCNRHFVELFERTGVDCVFSGDHHGYERVTRGRIRQVVNGCMGYFDHGQPGYDYDCNWYGSETLVGGHAVALTKLTWRFQTPGRPGVLGAPTPVRRGLFPGYATLEVRGDVATYRQYAFNADGSKIGVADEFTMRAGVRPDAPRGIAMERYMHDKTKFMLRYLLTGKGGAVLELDEKGASVVRFRRPDATGALVEATVDAPAGAASGLDAAKWRSTPIVDEAAGVVGVKFLSPDSGRTLTYRLLPDNTVEVRSGTERTTTYRGLRPTDAGGRDGLANPERGFRFEIGVGRCPDDFVKFAHVRDQWPFARFARDGVTVAQAYCYLTQFCDSPVGEEKLAALQADFDRARRDGVKFLLRFAYEFDDGKVGPTTERILAHIRQLTPIVRKNADVIYCLQTGWVGMWGEFHTSVHGIEKDPVAVGRIVKATLEMLPENRFTMMRRIAYKEAALKELGDEREIDATTAFTQAPHARIGFFNDGTLANWHDGATFPGIEPFAEPGHPEFDRAMREGLYMPVDGELFWNDDQGVTHPMFANALRAIERFRDQHYTTFSLVHGFSELDKMPTRGTIDGWKATPVTSGALAAYGIGHDPDYFAGVPYRTGFEFVRDHLGYRLRLVRATRNDEGDGCVRLAATVRNDGFAAPMNPRRPVVVVLAADGICTEHPVDFDCRRFAPGEERTFEVTLPAPAAGERLALWFPDEAPALRLRPDYAIRLANAMETLVADGRLLHLL